MINKNFYRKTNDKKILHKVGKQWKVISIALLLAIGGGAAVAANANADANVSSATQAEVNELETKPNVVSAVSSAPSSVASSKASAKPSSAVSYLSGYNGSAASYHAKVGDEQALYNANNTTVQSYVNSLNNVYPSQTSSLTNNYNSAKDQYNNDSSLAGSYSAIAATSGYSSEVSSLASKAGITYSEFVDSVGVQASTYNSQVSNNSKDASQMTTINSYAQLISALSGNSSLQNQYSAKATSASAESLVASYASSAAGKVYNNAVNNSSNDASLYNSARIASGSNDAAENVALMESNMDSNTTNIIASAMGYTNSSVTSSITSSFASAHADAILNAADHSDAAGALIPAAQQNITYSAINKSGSATSETLTFESSATSAVGNGANGQLINSNDVNQANLYQLLSNTAIMEQFGSKQALYNSEMASGSAAMSKDADLVSSASSASQSADNASISASNEYHVDSILADNPTLTNIFGSETPFNITATSYENSVVDFMNANNNVAINGINYDAADEATDHVPTNDDTSYGVDYVKYLLNNAASGQSTGNQVKANFVNSYTASSIALSQAFSALGSSNAGHDYVSEAYSTNAHNDKSNVTNLISDALSDAVGDHALSSSTSSYSAASELLTLASSYASLNGITSQNASTEASAINAAFSSSDDIKDSKATFYYTLSNAAAYASDAINTTSVAGSSVSTSSVAPSGGLVNANSFATDVQNDVNTAVGKDTISSGASYLASKADDYNNNYTSASSASASYSAATSENVTLASSYATSYSNDAENDATSVSAAKNSLDNFYVTHADEKYAKASSVAESAGSAAADAKALAHANGMHVFNYGPKFVTVTKNAQLHSDTDYTPDNIVAPVKAGTQFQVLGVGFAANGITRFLVNSNKGKLYLTGNTGYVKPTYLQAANGVSVTFTKDAKVYTDKAATKATGQTIPAGTTLSNVNIVSLDKTYFGSSRIETPSGKYLTANTKYVSLNGNEADAASGDTDNTTPNNGVVNYWD